MGIRQSVYFNILLVNLNFLVVAIDHLIFFKYPDCFNYYRQSEVEQGVIAKISPIEKKFWKNTSCQAYPDLSAGGKFLGFLRTHPRYCIDNIRFYPPPPVWINLTFRVN